MIAWLQANIGNIVVCALLTIAVCFTIRKMIRDKKAGKCSCSSNCGGDCSKCSSLHQ